MTTQFWIVLAITVAMYSYLAGNLVARWLFHLPPFGPMPKHWDEHCEDWKRWKEARNVKVNSDKEK